MIDAAVGEAESTALSGRTPLGDRALSGCTALTGRRSALRGRAALVGRETSALRTLLGLKENAELALEDVVGVLALFFFAGSAGLAAVSKTVPSRDPIVPLPVRTPSSQVAPHSRSGTGSLISLLVRARRQAPASVGALAAAAVVLDGRYGESIDAVRSITPAARFLSSSGLRVLQQSSTRRAISPMGAVCGRNTNPASSAGVRRVVMGTFGSTCFVLGLRCETKGDATEGSGVQVNSGSGRKEVNHG